MLSGRSSDRSCWRTAGWWRRRSPPSPSTPRRTNRPSRQIRWASIFICIGSFSRLLFQDEERELEGGDENRYIASKFDKNGSVLVGDKFTRVKKINDVTENLVKTEAAQVLFYTSVWCRVKTNDLTTAGPG